MLIDYIDREKYKRRVRRIRIPERIGGYMVNSEEIDT